MNHDEVKADENADIFAMPKLSEEEEKLKMNLRMLEVGYINSQGMQVGEEATNQLFPMGWFEDSNFELKAKIVVSAILQKKKIVEIPEYQQLVEGVRYK